MYIHMKRYLQPTLSQVNDERVEEGQGQAEEDCTQEAPPKAKGQG